MRNLFIALRDLLSYVYVDERGEEKLRVPFFTYWKGKASSALHTKWMGLKCKIAFKLLRGVADPCPHCNKLINISTWSKF